MSAFNHETNIPSMVVLPYRKGKEGLREADTPPQMKDFTDSYSYRLAMEGYQAKRIENTGRQCLALNIRQHGVTSLTGSECQARGCEAKANRGQLKFELEPHMDCPLGLMPTEEPVNIDRYSK